MQCDALTPRPQTRSSHSFPAPILVVPVRNTCQMLPVSDGSSRSLTSRGIHRVSSSFCDTSTVGRMVDTSALWIARCLSYPRTFVFHRPSAAFNRFSLSSRFVLALRISLRMSRGSLPAGSSRAGLVRALFGRVGPNAPAPWRWPAADPGLDPAPPVCLTRASERSFFSASSTRADSATSRFSAVTLLASGSTLTIVLHRISRMDAAKRRVSRVSAWSSSLGDTVATRNDRAFPPRDSLNTRVSAASSLPASSGAPPSSSSSSSSAVIALMDATASPLLALAASASTHLRRAEVDLFTGESAPAALRSDPDASTSVSLLTAGGASLSAAVATPEDDTGALEDDTGAPPLPPRGNLVRTSLTTTCDRRHAEPARRRVASARNPSNCFLEATGRAVSPCTLPSLATSRS